MVGTLFKSINNNNTLKLLIIYTKYKMSLILDFNLSAASAVLVNYYRRERKRVIPIKKTRIVHDSTKYKYYNFSFLFAEARNGFKIPGELI